MTEEVTMVRKRAKLRIDCISKQIMFQIGHSDCLEYNEMKISIYNKRTMNML